MRRLMLLALPVLVSCATTPPPVELLAAARASVGQAQPATSEEAPLELAEAQTKLARAEEAMQRGDYEDARRLAEQADLDAKLAAVVAQNMRTQRNTEELDRSIDALREELRKEDQ